MKKTQRAAIRLQSTIAMPKYKPATRSTAALACYNRSIVFLAEYLHCRTRPKYAMQVRVQKWRNSLAVRIRRRWLKTPKLRRNWFEFGCFRRQGRRNTRQKKETVSPYGTTWNSGTIATGLIQLSHRGSRQVLCFMTFIWL